jgi:hypothetical protein
MCAAARRACSTAGEARLIELIDELPRRSQLLVRDKSVEIDITDNHRFELLNRIHTTTLTVEQVLGLNILVGACCIDFVHEILVPFAPNGVLRCTMVRRQELADRDETAVTGPTRRQLSNGTAPALDEVEDVFGERHHYSLSQAIGRHEDPDLDLSGQLNLQVGVVA